jgi:hypothetical protein
MKHTAARMGSDWDFKVITDKDLMTAWLATVALKGEQILDADVASTAAAVSTKFLTIEDLVEPPDILVIRLGIKTARNVAMSEVLHEALSHRAHLSKITWVTDQPSYRLNSNHICHSDAVEDFFREWRRVLLTDPKSTKSIPSSVMPKPQRQSSSQTSTFQTKSIADEFDAKAKAAEKKKRDRKRGRKT